MKRKLIVGALVVSGATYACQSGGGDKPAEPAAVAKPAETAKPAEMAEPEEPAGEPGAIEVSVTLNGDAPKMEPLNRKADPFCAKTKRMDETVVVGKDGTLANVAITIEKVRGKFETPKEALVVDQKECMYSPRVSTAMTDQPIEITNSDMTLHNVHTYKGENEANWFNKAQPPKAAAIAQKAPGDSRVIFRCDVHPWMGGYVVVSDNPFHGVTDASGKVTLEGVPSRAKAYEGQGLAREIWRNGEGSDRRGWKNRPGRLRFRRRRQLMHPKS